MASKIIFDHPNLLDETLLSLPAACKHFPVPPSRSAVERWIRKGRDGVVLETVLICGRRYTTKEAIDRFIRGQLKVEPEKASAKRGNMSRRDIEAAALRFGLPAPQGNSNQQGRS